MGSGSMFDKAVTDSRRPDAARLASRMPPNAALAKQLFPSSSPAAANNQDGNIVEMLKKHSPATHAQPRPRASAPENPLVARPANMGPPPSHRTSNSSKAFASLYGQSGSFEHEPPRPAYHPPAAPPGGASKQPKPAVYLCDDDFSDDDQLDFEAPSALPELPPNQPPQQPYARQLDDPPPSNTSAMSWSQSSPSHRAPPPARTNKREAREEEEAAAAPVVKKPRRELPKTFGANAKQENTHHHQVDATPASKSSNAPWNKTASALKADKKQQLKQQQQKAHSAGDYEATADGTHQATRKLLAAKATAAVIHLSAEQRHVQNLVVEQNKSVFFTGPAGTGKSVLMRSIIQELKRKHARDPERVAVTASTGLAACNIGGMTLHSFSGIGLGKEDAQTLVKKIRRNQKASNRWKKTKTLIIDEVSMVDGDLFDKLSQIGRTLRNNGRPWGGIQLVITGDFFQLPPVPEGGNKQAVKFAFDAATWNTSIDHTIGLTEVFRQKDPEFARMLNEMRLGKITEQTVLNFKTLSRPLHFDDGLEVTELFPTRNEVEAANQKRLKELTGKAHRFDAFDTGDKQIRDRLLSNMMAPPKLELKKGAQVMLIKNMDDTLVNGSLGTVVGFMNETAFELMGETGGYEEKDESESAKRMRALTSALSNRQDIQSISNTEYPLVCFHSVDGTQRHLLCVPEDWKVELPTGEVQAARKQLPLILAWALSIHKAQGQTLERVKVDLGKVFEKGQAYVALSRATTQQGLQVLRFQKDKVMAHPRVIGFYNKLYSAEMAVQEKKQQTVSASIKNFAYGIKPPQPAAPAAKTMKGAPGPQYADFDEDEEEAMAAYG